MIYRKFIYFLKRYMKEPLEIVLLCASPQQSPEIAGLAYDVPRSRPDVTVRCLPPAHLPNLVSNIRNFKPTMVVVSTRNIPPNEQAINMLRQLAAARIHVILTPPWPNINFPYFHGCSSKQQVRSLIDKLLDSHMFNSQSNSSRSGHLTVPKLQRQLIINIVRSSDKGFNDQMSNLRFRYNNLSGLAFRQVNYPNEVRPMPHQQHILIIFKDQAKMMRNELQNISQQYPIFKILFKSMVSQAALNQYFHMATSNLQSVQAQVDKFLAMQAPSSQYVIPDKMSGSRMQPSARSISAPAQREEGLRNSKIVYVNQNGQAVNRQVDVGNRGNIDPRYANPALLEKLGVNQASAGSSIRSYNQYYNLNNPTAISPQLSLTAMRPLSSLTARSASSSTYRIRLESARRVSQKNPVRNTLQPRLYIIDSQEPYFKQLSTTLQTMCRPIVIKQLRQNYQMENGAILLLPYEIRRNLMAYLMNKKPRISCILFGEELFPDQILNNPQITLVTQNPQHIVQYLRHKSIKMTQPISTPNLMISPPAPSLKVIEENKNQKPKSVRFIEEESRKVQAVPRQQTKPLIPASSSKTIISELAYTHEWLVRKRPGVNVFVTYAEVQNEQQYMKGPMPGIRSTNKLETKIIHDPRLSIKAGRPLSVGLKEAKENAAKAREDYFQRIHTEPDPRLLTNQGTRIVEQRLIAQTNPRIEHPIVNPPSNQGSNSQTNSLKLNSNQSYAADRLVASFGLRQMTIPVSPVAPFSRAGPVPMPKPPEKVPSRRKIINLAETSFSNYSHLNINSMKTSNITTRQAQLHSHDNNPFTLTKANKPYRPILQQTPPQRQDATQDNVSGLSQHSNFNSVTSSSSSSSKTETKQIDKKKQKLRNSNSSQQNAAQELANSLEQVDEEEFKKQAGQSDGQPRKRPPTRQSVDSKTKISKILEQAVAIKPPQQNQQQKYVINYKIPVGGSNTPTLTPQYSKDVKAQQIEQKIIVPEIPRLLVPPRMIGNTLLSPTNYIISQQPNEGGSLIDRQSRVQPESVKSIPKDQPSLTKQPSWYDSRIYDKRLENGQYIYIRKTSNIAAPVLEQPISDKAASFSKHSNSLRQQAQSSINQNDHSNKVYNAMTDMTNNHLDHRIENGISIYSRKSYKSPIRIEENSNPTQYGASIYQYRPDQIREDLEASQSQMARSRKQQSEHLRVVTKSSVQLPRSKDEISPLANHFKTSSNKSDILYLVPSENVNLKNKLSLFVQKPEIQTYNSVEELNLVNYDKYTYALIFPRQNERTIRPPAPNAFFIHMLKPLNESPTNQLFINDLWQLSTLTANLGSQDGDKSSTGTLLRNHGVRLEELLRMCNDRSKLLYSSNEPQLQDILTRRLINKVIPIKFHDAEQLMDRVRQYSKDCLVVLMDSSMMPYISEIKSTARLAQIIVLDRFNRSTISRDMDVRIVNSFQQALRAVQKIA